MGLIQLGAKLAEHAVKRGIVRRGGSRGAMFPADREPVDSPEILVEIVIAHEFPGAVVNPQVERGTRFDADLPAAPPPRADGPAVLVVDDDPVIREVVRALLEAAGHAVLSAGTLADAVAIAGDPRHAVRTVLADVVMPGVRGLELFERLREARPEARIVAVSGLGPTIPADDLRELGVTCVLAKPFTGAQLLAAVRGE